MAERLPSAAMSAARQYAPRQPLAKLLCGDGSWRPCEVLAWAKSQKGWVALVRWEGGQDWLVYDVNHIKAAQLIRRGPHESWGCSFRHPGVLPPVRCLSGCKAARSVACSVSSRVTRTHPPSQSTEQLGLLCS